MPKGKSSGRGAKDAGTGDRSGQGTPPQDRAPVKVDFEFGKKYPMQLKPGREKPWETIAFLVGGGRTNPPLVGIEGVPPKFNPLENIVDVEISFVSRDGKTVKGKIVGSEAVVKQADQEWQRSLVESGNYWNEKYPAGEEIRIPVMENGRLQFEDVDAEHNFLPLKLKILNLPRDWRPAEDYIYQFVKVKQITDDPKTKELIVELYAVNYAETGEQLRGWERTISERINKKQNQFPLPVEFLDDLKKEGDHWKLSNIQTGEIIFDAFFELPEGWTKDQLKPNAEGQVQVIYTEWAEVSRRLQLLCHFEGFEVTKAAPPSGVEKKEEKKRKVGILQGKDLHTSVKANVVPETFTRLEPLLTELDSPESEAKGFSERLEILRKIESILAEERRRILADVEKFESDPNEERRYKKIGEEKTRVITEIKRVEGEIETARKILSKEREEVTAREAAVESARAAERAAREADLAEDIAEYTPLVQDSAEFKVAEEGIETQYITQVADLLRRKSELEQVYLVRDQWLQIGGRKKRPDGARYPDQDFVRDLLIADGLIPLIQERVVELGRIASGAPAPVVPPPPPPDLGLPGPVVVPETPALPEKTAPAEVEVEEELSVEEMVAWLEETGFVIGEFVGFTAASRRRMAKGFGLTEALPEQLRIRSISVPYDEVELELPDFFTIVVSIEQLYLMEQEMSALKNEVDAAGIVTNAMVELSDTAALALLRPRMEHWIIKHAGQALPNKVRIEGVDLVSGEITLDVKGASEAGVIRVPLELMAEQVRAKKVKILETIVPLEAGEREARLESVRRGVAAERPLSQEVVAGQTWKYNGPPSKRLNPGGDFRVTQVDDEKDLITVVTAKEEADAASNHRLPKTFLVSRELWKGLTKTFVRGPQPKTGLSESPEEEEERLLREIKVGQLYAYEGVAAPPFLKNDQFKITSLDTEQKTVTFVITREEAAALAKKQRPQPYKLKLRQWKLIKKRLITGGGPGRPPEGPTPPPAPRTPDRGSAATPRTVVAEERSAPRDVLPPPEVVSASYPPKPEQIETPNSFTALVDLMRSKDLINLVRTKLTERAGLLGGLILKSGITDPFSNVQQRIERIATDSGAALTVKNTLAERLTTAVSAGRAGAQEALAELNLAERAYRETEIAALKNATQTFNDFMSGRKEGVNAKKAEDLTKSLEGVQKALERLQKANERARKVLESTPPSNPAGAVRRVTRSSS